MNRRQFLITSSAALFNVTQTSWPGRLSGESNTSPNIILILADDLGYNGVGCYGNDFIETPHIDLLSKQGMKFTNGYANCCTCAPSRAAIMSGQYSPRTQIYRVVDRTKGKKQFLKYIQPEQPKGLALEKITIAEALKQKGYATAYLGKWHLGYGEKYHPKTQGFDLAIESHGKHFNFKTDPPMDIPEGTYLGDFLTDKSIDFIKTNTQKKQPFFLFLAHFLIHGPLEAKEKYMQYFSKKLNLPKDDKTVLTAAMTKSLDDSVGRIMEKLKELKIDENTLIIFTSDNGAVISKTEKFNFNKPFRSGKGQVYEGGIRVPYIFKWLNKIKPGTVCHEPVIGIDLYPILLDVANIKPDPDYPLDGTSVKSCLVSEGKAKLDREAIYWFFPKYAGYSKKTKTWRDEWRNVIRMGDYKLIEYIDRGTVELFNLKKDIGEKEELSKKMPEKTGELLKKLNNWKKQIKAPIPTPNPDFKG